MIFGEQILPKNKLGECESQSFFVSASRKRLKCVVSGGVGTGGYGV